MNENNNSIDGNLFILTGVGQLRNILGFIRQYNATNNIAIVLYTNKNLSVVQNIERLAQKEKLIKDIQFVKLPIKLLEEEKNKSILIYKELEKALDYNIKEYNIKNLFLCSYSIYYKFFGRLAKKKNISINLLEEGLTTYRVYAEKNEEKNYKVNIQDVLTKAKKVLNKLYIVFKPLINFLKSIIEFIVTLISCIIKKNLIYYIKCGLKKLKKYKYGVISKFNNVYVCYPELMEKVNGKVGNIHKLNFNFENSKVKFTSDEDKENIIFINQKYGVRYKEHFPIVFSILRDMGVKKVYIKFHPKEDVKALSETFNEVKEQYPDIEVIPLDKVSHIPVENLINTNHITKVIALTSSSLFYCKLVNENVETISIAEEYKKRCIEMGVADERMKNFLEDYRMIDILFHVKQFEFNKENENNKNGGILNEQECSVYSGKRGE